jgi:hypothetical protein
MVAKGGIDNFAGSKIGHAQHARRVRYRDVAQQPPTHKMIVGGSPGKYLVAKGGIEPPTQGFSVLCSTN